MREQPRFGLALSWPRITSVFVIDVAVLALASHWPAAWQTDHIAWWVGVVVALAVTIVGLVTYRRNTLASALAARVLDRFADPQAMLTLGRTPPIDHQRRYGRDVVGIREYQGRLVAVIAVEAREDATSGRHRHQEDPSSTLPVEAVVSRLRQFDVRFDEIDIVSVGTQVPAGDDDGDDPKQRERSALDEHNTWLVLRMDPQRNIAAIAARDSVASTLAAATERLAHDLDGRRCAARPVTADEFAEVESAVLAGLQPEHVRARRRRLKYKDPEGPNEYVTSFWVSPDDITSTTLHDLWLPNTNATAVTVRLVARRGGADVSAWVRYHSDKRLRREVWSGLNRLTGRQLVAVCASLPVPRTRPLLLVPDRPLDDGEQLSVPVGKASQSSAALVGAHW
ncbi:MAG: type VII secretion protein EccE [Mycobacterium sp.]|nr:type VII secretion protein EccE [Mycobacterium sp.]